MSLDSKGSKVIPNYWYDFLEKNKIVGEIRVINKEHDLSGVGIKMKFLSLRGALTITLNRHPARFLANFGYVPIGLCMYGSGDNYYINKNDGKNGRLYRIYYDGVNNKLINDGAIDRVFNNYESILLK